MQIVHHFCHIKSYNRISLWTLFVMHLKKKRRHFRDTENGSTATKQLYKRFFATTSGKCHQETQVANISNGNITHLIITQWFTKVFLLCKRCCFGEISHQGLVKYMKKVKHWYEDTKFCWLDVYWYPERQDIPRITEWKSKYDIGVH